MRPSARLVVATIVALLGASACGGAGAGSAGNSPGVTGVPASAASHESPSVYNDPRGGDYAAFQNTFDRSRDPFSSPTSFCDPTDKPDEKLRQIEPGITASKIVVAQIRTRLEELTAYGLNVYVGNVSDMFSVFAKYVNEHCGGVNGRQIELDNVDVTALGNPTKPIDVARNDACVTATENWKAPIVVNASGFLGTGILCIVEDHQAIYVTANNGSYDYLSRSGGRLFGTTLLLDDYNSALAHAIVNSGIAKNKTIGVVDSDTPGQFESTKSNFIEVLQAAGLKVAVYKTLGCKTTSLCDGGLKDTVSQLLAAKVDFIYPNLNVLSLPGFVKELADQGAKPGSIQFVNSNFNDQADDLAASKVVELGGKDAGDLYNGAIMFGPSPAGYQRQSDDPTPFMKMCNDVYRANSTLPDVAGTKFSEAGKNFRFKDDAEVIQFNMVGSACAVFRVVLRGIYHAGTNPTRDDIARAISRLGPIDLPYMVPGTLSPGKGGAPNALFQMKFNYPCPTPTTAKSGSCITQVAGPLPLKLQ